MTQVQAEAYFTYLAKQSGLVADGLEAHIKNCISMGLNEFWNAKQWSWSTSKFTLTWASPTSEQELPAEIMGVVSVRELSSPNGRRLLYRSVEEFEQMMPYPESHPSTNPQMFTVFYNKTVKKWYVRFYNQPSIGMRTEWLIYTNIADDIQRVPDKFVGGLTLCIDKYIYKLGTPEQIMAVGQYYKTVLPALEVRDNPFQGHLFRHLDDTEAGLTTSVPWVRP